ncbi:DUF4229 domain-containing protein [Geodermatophilus sp. TF02-6]|uniref:DUF4229 domain-containing protein n=1 Tax=Geodermatophilus sp. TF02-6 TaxID=2250575 RepID=UPI000DEAA3B7|nr:DUF4229 domain-containing protein [Geodermatophilus sp. TF02-6]RBY75039.1 DUF4229 domain-containing protein [Geodermatophilus sp. TF02-6]
MAERVEPTGSGASSAGPAAPTRIAPWLAIYTVGRFAIAVALVLLLWWLGLAGFLGLLLGVLLSMPVSYLLLRPSRDRLTAALAARSTARKQAKAAREARLAGDD